MPRSVPAELVSRLALASTLLASVAAAGCAVSPSEEAAGATEDELTRAQCRGPRGESEAACRLSGVVEKQVVAEMDPFVVGDACVTFVKVGARRLGLVQDASACPSPDRFAAGKIGVTFSKGALTLASRERSRVLKDYDAGATYYELAGALREETDGSGLPGFDGLSAAKKLETLYDVRQDWAVLRDGYSLVPVRIVDALQGEAQRSALEAYYEMRDHAFASGGAKPEVAAVQKGGVTYAYQIATSGRSYGNWAELRVFDRRSFAELGAFGYSD